MKKDLKLMAVVLMAVSSCRQPGKQTATDSIGGKSKDTVVVKTILASNRDMACGMGIADDVKDTVHYEGKVYGFCSPYCKKDFLANPKSFLKQ